MLAGAAPNTGVLIGARAVQGIFGALLTPGSLALLRATYKDEAGQAIGAWTAWTGVATAAGPVIGGTLVEAVSWRVIFFLNIPFAIVTIAATLVSRDTCRTDRHDRRLDIPGVVLGAVGIGALVWALVQGPKDGFGSAGRRPRLRARGALALAGFVLVEWRSAHPMMPLSLFRIRELSVANLATFFIYAALGSALFFLVLFAQSVLGYSPAKAGLIVVPISISLLLLAARFGRAADRIGPRPFLVGGPVLIGIGLALLGLLDAGSSYWVDVFPPLIVFSVGLSATVPAVTSTALKPAPEGLTGVASGINTTVSRVGQLVAVAGLGVVVSLVYSSTGEPFSLGSRTPDELASAADAFPRGDVGLRRPRVRRRARQRARSSSAAERAKRSDRARSRQRLSACSRVAPCSVKIASRKLAVSLCPCSESRSPGRTSSSRPGSASGTASTNASSNTRTT